MECNYGNKNEMRFINIEFLKKLLNENFDKLINVLDNFGIEWYKMIDFIIINLKDKIIDINKKYWFNFEKKEKEIKFCKSESLEMRDYLKDLLDFWNVIFVCNYKLIQEKKVDFKKLLFKFNFLRLEFYLYEIDMMVIFEIFGCLCE